MQIFSKINNLYFIKILVIMIIILSLTLNGGSNIFAKIIGIIFISFSVFLWLKIINDKKKYYSNNEIDLKQNNTKIFISKSIFSYVRYPNYLSIILLTIGITFVSQNLLLVVLTYFTIKLLSDQINLDEKHFGKSDSVDINYADTVPKLNILKGFYNKLKKSKLIRTKNS